MAECFYCFQDRKLTRAHLFQTRFREVLEVPPDNRVYLGSASVSRAGIDRSIAYPGDIREAHVTALCSGCNNKWMEPIERAAAPVFAQLMGGEWVPQPPQMLVLAHWAVVFSALSSELYPALDIPREHRDVIRRTEGQPREYCTYIVWTSDRLASIEMNLFRAIASPTDGEEPAVRWVNVLQAGPATIITAAPDLSGRVARVLAEHDISSAVGLISSNLVYVPEGWKKAMTTGPRPSHRQMHDLGSILVGAGRLVTAPNGQDMLDLTGGLHAAPVEMSFDFEGRLHDYRDLRGSENPAG